MEEGVVVSKFSLDVLNRRVFPFVGHGDSSVMLEATFGEDVALTRVGGDILASHVDPIIGAVEHIGWLAVHVACNDIAAAGVPPRWILLLVLVPREKDEDLLEQIMRDAGRAAAEVGVCIVGGHTGYSSGISRPLVAVTALGTASGREPVRTGGAQVGHRVLVTKGIALEGTAILSQDFSDVAIRLGLREDDLEEARHLADEVSVVPEALALAAEGVTAMHDVTRGGVLEALLEVAQCSQVGIDVEASLFPMRPVVARFARAFQFDPLWMISSGSLVATVSPEHSEAVANALGACGVPFAFIGRVAKGQGVRIFQNGKIIHHRRPLGEVDELARLWELYPRG